MIYSAIRMAHMLPGTDRHTIGRCHVEDWRLARVGVRKPYGNGKAILTASEVDWDGAREVQKKSRGAIVEGYK